MPLYEYQCKKCGHRFERIQSFSAEPLKVCPVCEGQVERLISAPSVQFKGSGFYSTDYGAKRPAKPAAGDGAPAAHASSDGGSSSEKPSGEKSAPSKSESPGGGDTPASKPTPA